MPENVVSYVSIGLTVFMAVCLLFGFLLGIIRGWRKSTLRFGIFVGISVIVLLFMPLILKATISNAQLQQMVENLITQQMPELANVYVGAITSASAIALAAVGSIVFLGLFIVIQLLTWIIFGICKLFLRKYKMAPKRRFIGGLIGLVQGLFVCFIFMIPVAGFTNIADKVVSAAESVVVQLKEEDDKKQAGGEAGAGDQNQPAYSIVFADEAAGDNSGNADSGSGADSNQTGSTIKTDYTQTLKTFAEAKKAIATYRKSMPGFIYGIGKGDNKLDIATFNYLSQAEVNGNKVKLTDEVNNLTKAVKNIVSQVNIAKLSNYLSANDMAGLSKYLNTQDPDELAAAEDPTQVLTYGQKLFNVVGDVIFDSNLIKALMVDGVNALATDTENVLNDTAKVSATLRETLDLPEVVSIDKITVKGIDWTKEKQTFSKIINNVVTTALDFMDATKDTNSTENNNSNESTNPGENEGTNNNTNSSNELDLSKLPLEALGEAIDLIKGVKDVEGVDDVEGLQIFKNLSNYGLKRLISVEKLIEETKENGSTSDDSSTSTTTTTTKMTISKYVRDNTKFGEGENAKGIDLDEIKDYRKVCFKELMLSVKEALALKDAIDAAQDGKLPVGIGADLGNVLEGLTTLPPELKQQLNDVVVDLVGDQKLFGDDKPTLNQLGLDKVNIIDSAGVVAPLIDVASTVMNITGEGENTTELKVEDINKIVSNIEKMGENINNLSADDKQNLNNFVGETINSFIGDGADKIFDKVDGENYGDIIGEVANDSAIVDVVLKTNFVKDDTTTTDNIVDALVANPDSVVVDMLTKADQVPTIFKVEETQDQVKQKLVEKGVDADKAAKLAQLFAQAE